MRRRVTLITTIVFFGLCILAIYLCFENTKFKELLLVVASLTGAVAVFIQIKRTRDLATGEFILNLQQEFTEKHSDLFIKCWDNRLGGEEIALSDGKQVLNYLTFFESMFIMVERDVLTIKMLDELFGRRFFMVVNNEFIQDKDLTENYRYYLNVYRLYAKWKEYRLSKKEVIFDKNDYKSNRDLEFALKDKDADIYDEIFPKKKDKNKKKKENADMEEKTLDC